MENALKKAIDGGWNERNWFEKESNFNQSFLLDPLFWQALGKQQGWEKYGTNNTIWQNVEKWKYYWHNFIDHIVVGGSIDDFFNNLLK